MEDIALEMRIPKKGPAGVLELVERKLPPPKAGEVRVAIEAVGVAYADIVIRRGLYNSEPIPLTPGFDLVGRIEGLGPGTAGLSIGQRVAGMTITGSYATRRNVQACCLAPAPEGCDAAALVAATLNGVTAWQMFHRVANAEAGDWVLVHGAAGGVGSLLVDFARMAGVNVIGSASPSKSSVVAGRGAVVVDYARENVAKRAQDISGGGVIAVFDHVGGRHFKNVSIPTLRAGGIGVLYGGYDATRGGKLRPLALLDLVANGRFSSFGLFARSIGAVGYSAPAWQKERHNLYLKDLAEILALVGDGKLSPLIGAVYPLAEAAAAHVALENRAVAGKIVLVN